MLLDRATLDRQPLLAPCMLVLLPGADDTPLLAARGLASLLGAAGQDGWVPDPATGRSHDQIVWWQPGPLAPLPGTEGLFGVEPGLWGLSGDGKPPTRWRLLRAGATVLAVIRPTSWTLAQARFIAVAPQRRRFLQDCARLLYRLPWENGEASERAFDLSVACLLRRLDRSRPRRRRGVRPARRVHPGRP